MMVILYQIFSKVSPCFAITEKLVLMTSAFLVTSTAQDQAPVTGKVKVAAICIGSGGADYDTKMAQAVEYLHIAGENSVDIACLPEAFATNDSETIPGRTTETIAKLAKQYNMYIIPILVRNETHSF
jgi:hypothetical protein